MDKRSQSEIFKTEGHALIDLLAEYLEQCAAGVGPVLEYTDPDELTEKFLLTDSIPPATFKEFMSLIIKYSNHLHHPGYIGHQNTPPLPLPALSHAAIALLNNGTAVYEMGQAGMACEKNVIGYMAELLGYDKEAEGIFTHGGSAGNLTAMLAIRQARAGFDVWSNGNSGQSLGYMVSSQAHYSVDRNVKIMGLGEQSVIRIPVTSNFSMDTTLLREQYSKALEKGIKPIAVVANSCSTATGSYDDLEEIARFCKEYDLWMHVDGAHGLGVLFDEKRKHLVKGIEHADSVIIDFHKMLRTTGLNTLVLFKDGDRSYETFAQSADYLFDKGAKKEWYNGAKRTLECTKNGMGIAAWTTLKFYGRDYFSGYINEMYSMTKDFAATLKVNKEFEIVTEPQSNILCFRYAPSGMDDEALNKINGSLRMELVNDGEFYLVQTVLNDKLWLRVTIINPETDMKHLQSLLDRIIEKGEKMIASSTLP